MILENMVLSAERQLEGDNYAIEALNWVSKEGKTSLSVYFDDFKEIVNSGVAPRQELLVRLPKCIIDLYQMSVRGTDGAFEHFFSDLMSCIQYAYALHQLSHLDLVTPLPECALVALQELAICIEELKFNAATVEDFKTRKAGCINDDYERLPF